MCNYPWCSLTPGIIFWILRLSLSVKFWMLKKNTAVPVTKVLISVSFLYHPLPPPPGVSVSQEPDVAVSVLHLQHWHWPSDWVSKCEPPNTFRPSADDALSPEDIIAAKTFTHDKKVRQLQRYKHLIDPDVGWVWIHPRMAMFSKLTISNTPSIPSIVQLSAWPTHEVW